MTPLDQLREAKRLLELAIEGLEQSDPLQDAKPIEPLKWSREDIEKLKDIPSPAQTVEALRLEVEAKPKILGKVAVVVGHNRNAKGAFSARLGMSEHVFNTEVADAMFEVCPDYGIDVVVFHRHAANSYSAEITECYQRVNKWNPDAVIELHFNAAGSPEATGSETLYHYGSKNGKRLAEAMQWQAYKALKLRSRGVKELDPGDNGFGSVSAAKAPCVIVEPFFGSNPKDCEAASKLGVEGLARAYLQGLKDYFEAK